PHPRRGASPPGSLAKHGTRGIARQRIPLLVIAGAVAAIVMAIAPNWSRIAAIPNASGMFAELQGVTSRGRAGGARLRGPLAVLSAGAPAARRLVAGAASGTARGAVRDRPQLHLGAARGYG